MANQRKLKDILFGAKKDGKTFAEQSTEALTKNQYEMVKNSTGKYLETTVYDVSIKDIDLSDKRFQMRLPDHDITEVKKSIAEEGQQTPVVLMQKRGNPKFLIISGFTRIQAIHELKQATVKAFVKVDLKDVQALTIALIENEARKDLTDWERIQGVVMLIKEGKTANQVALDIGKDKSTISLYQKVFASKEAIRNALKQNKINFTKAHILSVHQDKLSDKQIAEVIEKSKDLSVQNLKNVLSEVIQKSKEIGDAVDKEASKPKRAVSVKRDKFAVDIRFNKAGKYYKLHGKININANNATAVISRLEEIIAELKNIKE